MIRIILIRHGRTAWNATEGEGKRFRGTIDLPLAEAGVAQARATARYLAQRPLDAVYTSPLQRAASTAAIIAEPHGLAAQILPGLGSMDYGQWAGQSHRDVDEQWPQLYRKWSHDPFSIQIPDGESSTGLRTRSLASLRDVLSHHHDGDTIALVSHQVVARTLFCSLAGTPNHVYWLVHQDLCNVNRFNFEPARNEFALVGLNDTCHLSPALPKAGSGTRLLLIRHGQTAWNQGAGEERFRGRTDLTLDQTGQSQARALADRLGGQQAMVLYASPLLRTRQTLAPLANELDLPIQAHEGLIDIDYGRFQGLTHSRAAAAFPDQYSLWRDRPSQVLFPDGERLADVQSRLRALLEEMASRYPGQTVVLAGHQVVNKVLVCTLLGLDLDQIWRIEQDTCGIDVLQQVAGQWHTLRLNDVCHLA